MSAGNRGACDRCRSLRKRCDCRDGVYPCSRCVRNDVPCVARISGNVGRASSPVVGASKHVGNTADAGTSSQATGFNPALFETLAQLPPGHAGLMSATRFIIMTANDRGGVPPPLAALGVHAGLDMASLSAAPLTKDLTLQWSDMPANFRVHHDRARAYSQGQRFLLAVHFLRSTIRAHATEPLRAMFGADLITTEVVIAHFEEAHVPKLLKGLPHIVATCAQFDQVHTVVVDNVRMKTGLLVSLYLTKCVMSPEETYFAWELVPVEAAPIVTVEPSMDPLDWLLTEEDVRILNTLFE